MKHLKKIEQQQISVPKNDNCKLHRWLSHVKNMLNFVICRTGL